MKHMRTLEVPERTVPAHTKEICVNITCDFCSAKIENPDRFDLEEVIIKCERGRNWPEGGYSVTTSVDMCSKCFTEKFIPWAESQGATPEVTEEDW